MPNWATTRVTINGAREEIDALLRHLMPESEDRDAKIAAIGPEDSIRMPFTFEGIVPVPQTIKEIPSKGDAELGFVVMSDGAEDWMRRMDKIKTDEDWLPPELVATRATVLKKYALEEMKGQALTDAALAKDPECLRKAIAVMKAVKETGYPNVRSWLKDNWGAQSDADHADYQRIADDEVTIFIETASREPDKFLEKLVEAYPGLTINGATVEPGKGYAVTFSGDKGEFQIEDADYGEAYEEVYGEPAPEDEDENAVDFDEGDDFGGDEPSNDGEKPSGP